MMQNLEIDYSSYNLKELESAYENINRDKFPERFQILQAELFKRRNETPDYKPPPEMVAPMDYKWISGLRFNHS